MRYCIANDENAAAISESVGRFLEGIPRDAAVTPQIWGEMCALGILEIPALFEDGAGLAMVAAMERFGRNGIAGPLVATLAVVAAGPPDLAAEVVAEQAMVSLGAPPFMPFAQDARVFLTEREGELARLSIDETAPVEMLSDERWGRVSARVEHMLGPFGPLRDQYDLLLGAWLAGAAQHLIESAAEYAMQRRQFGRYIGEFQAVAHPLSRAIMAVDAAQALVRAASGQAGRLAAAARISSGRAARTAALVAHQTFGALGVIEEGPVSSLSRRIHQLSLQFPEERRGAAADAVGTASLVLAQPGDRP